MWIPKTIQNIRDTLVAINLKLVRMEFKIDAINSGRLSPADQAKLNQIFDRAATSIKKIDDTLK